MDVDDHRNDEDDPPRDLRDNLLLMQVLSEVVHRVGAARDNLVETQKVARFLDEIPFSLGDGMNISMFGTRFRTSFWRLVYNKC